MNVKINHQRDTNHDSLKITYNHLYYIPMLREVSRAPNSN